MYCVSENWECDWSKKLLIPTTILITVIIKLFKTANLLNTDESMSRTTLEPPERNLRTI